MSEERVKSHGREHETPRPIVCHLISSYQPTVGGAEKATQSLVAALARRGDDVRVITRRYSRDDARFERIDAVPVHRLGWPGRGKRHALTFGLHAIALLATRLRDRRVVHVQNIDTPMLVAMAARWALRRRTVATIHGHTPIIGKNTRPFGRARVAMMVRSMHRFTSINPENTAVLRAAGVPSDRVHEIPNGIAMDVFRPPSAEEQAATRAALGLAPDEFIVAYIGRLVDWKRVDLLIRAWARVAPAVEGRLLVVGDGPEAPALEALATQLGAAVRFEGMARQPRSYLWAADVFANASGDNRQQAEGLSVALLEAMATGVAPIVTQGAGNDVVVRDGSTGLSVPVEDVDAMADAIGRLAHDPALRRRLAEAAHQLVKERYDIDDVAARIEEVYVSLVELDGR